MDATRYLPFAGRLLIALTFVMSGLSKVADYSGTLGLILRLSSLYRRRWHTQERSRSRLSVA